MQICFHDFFTSQLILFLVQNVQVLVGQIQNKMLTVVFSIDPVLNFLHIVIWQKRWAASFCLNGHFLWDEPPPLPFTFVIYSRENLHFFWLCQIQRKALLQNWSDSSCSTNGYIHNWKRRPSIVKISVKNFSPKEIQKRKKWAKWQAV